MLSQHTPLLGQFVRVGRVGQRYLAEDDLPDERMDAGDPLFDLPEPVQDGA
jgi:hypothetical protein